ncbi:MAG: hypothetical protein IPF68_08540 [Bacteroidales bacterium]|nr:hypothetical protein [Bacteroidales bacterium]
MNNFLEIKTVYAGPNDRSTEDLKNCYSNPDLLDRAITQLLGNHLLDKSLISGKKVLLKPNWVLPRLETR